MNAKFKEWVKKYGILQENYWLQGHPTPIPPGTLYNGHMGSVGAGWVPLLTEMCEKLNALGDWDHSILQIKEKFGALRVYGNFTSEQQKVVDEACAKSEVTCEACGAPGSLKGRPQRLWLLTLCDACDAKGVHGRDMDGQSAR